MIRGIAALVAVFSSSILQAQFLPVQYADKYSVEIDISDRSDDLLSVTVVPPVINEDTVVYAMPKIVPGTYKIYNFGQFVKDFKAFDSRGKELSVTRLDENRWAIANGKSLYKITYNADDTEGDSKANVFLPGGTAVESDGVLLNAFGYVGFMQGHEHLPYTYEVAHGDDVVATTALDIVSESAKRDVFYAKDYFELHDRPVMYAADDRASTMVAGAEVTVGVYSPAGNLSAQELLDGISPVFEAAAEYLGGSLPTDRYVVLIWGRTLEQVMSDGMAGALEHFTSTTLVMPDATDQTFQMFGEDSRITFVRHIVAHEFFHIITPLNIHSQHIHNYDFINPQMSAHLWFYEGITEYNSLISQVRGGIMSESDFMEEMVEKLHFADNFNEHIPMTVRSEHALDIFEDQYMDVYMKGALIGMALDMHMREATNGEQGLVDLLITLKNEYGPDTFFVDDHFFDIIVDHTPEGTEEFLYEHIAGTAPLPLEGLFDKMGYEYNAEVEDFGISEPSWSTSYMSSRSKYYIINGVDQDDEFTSGFGLRKGDQLVRWNGEKVKGGELSEVLEEWKEDACIGNTVTIEVIRTNAEGDEEKLELSSVVTMNVEEDKHILNIKENPSAEELELKNSWLNL